MISLALPVQTTCIKFPSAAEDKTEEQQMGI